MKPIWGFVLALGASIFAANAATAECNVTYTVKAGDTLTSIAQDKYGDTQKWALIYYSNQKAMPGANLDVTTGMELHIPCSFEELAPDKTPLRSADADIKFLTGGNIAPISDLDWPGQGIVTELINAIMEDTPSPVSYSITWDDDTSKHQSQLDAKEFDMGFPWFRPDCEGDPDDTMCQDFHFSDPLIKVLVVLYTRNGSDNANTGILGKTLCRPSGYPVHFLDRTGREWLKTKQVTLLIADTPNACFDLLMQDKVDAVVLNSLLGAQIVHTMGLGNQVSPFSSPISEETLHIVISKRHWRGTTHLYRINAGIAAIKESGRYNQIILRHLSIMENLLKN
ncbi:MAG: transporter substrate-binding domain-containing protein [Paracoccaceae bacterium]